MGHTLRLELADDLYEPLVKRAKQTGSTPEKVVANWLVTVIRTAVDDPVEKFIGSFHSKTKDWADKHDKYLGINLKNQDDMARDIAVYFPPLSSVGSLRPFPWFSIR